MNFARIIRDAREKLKLNQSQLAELIGVSPQAVQQWESGATQPRGKRLSKIAEVLKLPHLINFGFLVEEKESRLNGTSQSTVLESRAPVPTTRPEKQLLANEPLIKQVIEAMSKMTPEDAARLVTISKALVGGPAEEQAVDLKPLPKPDLAPHPSPAFPPRRLPGGNRAKARG